MSDDLKTAKTALAKLHQDILGANPHWQDIFNQATATSRIGGSLSAAHPAFVLPGTIREICTTGFALETLRLWDERDEEDVGTEIQLVSAWIPGNPNQQYLVHEGSPTRRARVLYVCRELNNDPLTEFLTHDTRALVKLFELFNRVHELEIELTDKQLRAIFLKTDSSLPRWNILRFWQRPQP